MKKVALCIISLLMIGIYMVSTMGVGLHECKHDGTKNLIVFFGETPCEYVHSHIDDNGHIYTHSHKVADSHYHSHSANEFCTNCRSHGTAENFEICSYIHTGSCCSTTSYVLSQEQVLQDRYVDFCQNYSIAIQYNTEACSLNICETPEYTYPRYIDKYKYRSVSLPLISQFII